MGLRSNHRSFALKANVMAAELADAKNRIKQCPSLLPPPPDSHHHTFFDVFARPFGLGSTLERQ